MTMILNGLPAPLPANKGRSEAPTSDNMTTVCFRVTRACNLRCAYCQAPPNGQQLGKSELLAALSFFASNGTRRIKFTGGEPFVNPHLLWLVEHCRALGMESTIITNGTMIPADGLRVLSAVSARVKVSLHGFRERHDHLQGRVVYESVVANVRRYVDSGIHTSIHTLLHRSYDLDLSRWIEFLVGERVRKVSFMSFVPRGRGKTLESQFRFSEAELCELSAEIDALATVFAGMITVRFLDFARQPYLVFETDGRVLWEVADEARDEPLLVRPLL